MGARKGSKSPSAREVFQARIHVTDKERRLLAKLVARMADRLTNDVCNRYGLSGILRTTMRRQIGEMGAEVLLELLVELGEQRAKPRAGR